MAKKMLIGDGRKIAACSSALNLLLTGIKGYLALLTGSRALLAETVHSLTDVVGNLAVLSGIILSRRQSPSFPWGLYKVENIGALISAFFLLLGAYEIGKSSLIAGRQVISHVGMSVPLLFVMVIPIFIFARYEKREAERINSPSLMADSRHWMADIAPLGIVIAGVGGSLIYPHADRFASLVVIIFIIKAGYKIVRDSVKSLLDASVDAKTLEEIRAILKRFSEIEKVKSVNARNSGSFIFVHLDIRLSMKKLEEAHHLADLVEDAIRKEIPFVERVSIHYEPVKREYTEYAVPLASREGEISEHFGSAPFIGIWNKRMNEDAVLSQQILDNPFLDMEKGKGIKLAEFLAEKGVNVLYVKKPFEGKGPEYVFSNYEVEVRITDKEMISQLIEHIKIRK